MPGVRELLIKLLTRSDTSGARDTEQALGDVKREGQDAGRTVQDAGEAGEDSLGSMAQGALRVAPAIIAVAAAWKGVQKAVQEVTEAMQAAGEQQVLDAQQVALIEATGGAAGLTAAQLEEMRTALSQLTKVADESIERAQNLLLTFKGISDPQIFQDTLEVAVNMGAIFGDAGQAALQLGKALEDPVTQLTYLRRSGVSFSQAQIDMIRTLVESGRKLEAQREILRVLQGQFGDTAEAAGKTLAGAMQAVRNAADDAKQAFGSWVGELPAARSFLADLEGGLRAVEAWFPKVSKRAGEARVEFQGIHGDADFVIKQLDAMAQKDLGNLPVTAEALAKHLEDAAKAADAANQRIDALARAQLELVQAEIERDVAQGKISKEEGERRKLALKQRHEQEQIDRALAEQRKRVAEVTRAEAEAQNRLRQASEKHDAAIAAAGERPGDPAAMAERNRAARELEEAHTRAREIQKMAAEARQQLAAAEQVGAVRRRAVGVRTEAGFATVAGREAEQRRREDERLARDAARSIRDQLRDVERAAREEERDRKAGKGAAGAMQADYEREQREAQEAQAALEQFRETGVDTGTGRRYGSKSFSFRRKEQEMETAHQKELSDVAEVFARMQARDKARQDQIATLKKKLADAERDLDNRDI